jgi:hypothetical protein
MEIGNIVPVDEVLDIKVENECTLGSIQNILNMIITILNQIRSDISDFEKNVIQLKEKIQDQTEVLEENIEEYTEYLEEVLNRISVQISTKVPSKSGNSENLLRKYSPTHKLFTHKLTYIMPNHIWVRDQTLCTIDNICVANSNGPIVRQINFGQELYEFNEPIGTTSLSIDDFISAINSEISKIYLFQEQVIKNIQIIEIAFVYIDKLKQYFNI